MPVLKAFKTPDLFVIVQFIHGKHLLDLLGSLHQEITVIEMLSFAIVAKLTFLFLRTLIYHVTLTIAPETYSFLGTFL